MIPSAGRPGTRPRVTWRDVNGILLLDKQPGLSSNAALQGVREFPARVQCASLCWHTLDAALHRQTEPVRTE